MLILNWNSDSVIIATAEDINGNALLLATGTVTIVDENGNEVVSAASMTDVGDGTYTYDVAKNTDTESLGAGKSFKAQVTLSKNGKQSYAEVNWVTRKKTF